MRSDEAETKKKQCFNYIKKMDPYRNLTANDGIHVRVGLSIEGGSAKDGLSDRTLAVGAGWNDQLIIATQTRGLAGCVDSLG